MPTPTINAARGSMPILQFCTPAQLDVDPSYQRPTDGSPSRTLINKITREWDWGLYQPLVIARRPDGRLYIVDGQHRWEAAQQRGDIPQLPCVITTYENEASEAAAFVAINQQRRPLSKLNLFKAALASGDADAMAIAAIIERAGLKLTAAADARVWKPGWINNIVAVQQSFRQHGDKVTRASLEVMAEAFTGQVLRHCGTMFGAIQPLVAARGDAFSRFLLVEILRDAQHDAWMTRFRDAGIARDVGPQFAAKQLLAEQYAEAEAE